MGGLVRPQWVQENERTRRFVSRMYNWKFTQALSAMPPTVTSETSVTVEALSATFGNVGHFDGELGMIVAAAVASVIGYEDDEVVDVDDDEDAKRVTFVAAPEDHTDWTERDGRPLTEKVRRELREEPDEWGAHRAHCCRRHGCKYGKDDCPVARGEVVQRYPCERCPDPEDARARLLVASAEYDWVRILGSRIAQAYPVEGQK